MVPPAALCDEYFSRSKLTEQKSPFEYIVPLHPQEGSNNNIFNAFFLYFFSPCKYLLTFRRM